MLLQDELLLATCVGSVPAMLVAKSFGKLQIFTSAIY